MKLAKGVVLFFLIGLVVSCFNPPEFPVKPEIEFESLVFGKGSTGSDSLVLSIRFKDGDGDLGIDPLNADFVSDPYHNFDFYLANDGDTIKISTEKVYDDIPPVLKVDAGQIGKLVTNRTRNQPEYGNLPEFDCYYYNYDSVYVSESDKNIFDNTYFVKRIIPSTASHPIIYQLLDTFYIKENPNHYNIIVKFETKNSNGTYTEFDWRKPRFCSNYDGRFPVLAESKVPLDGTLRYTMKSAGFISLFGGKTLRLQVQIKDRALHSSNTIYTRDIQIN